MPLLLHNTWNVFFSINDIRYRTRKFLTRYQWYSNKIISSYVTYIRIGTYYTIEKTNRISSYTYCLQPIKNLQRTLVAFPPSNLNVNIAFRLSTSPFSSCVNFSFFIIFIHVLRKHRHVLIKIKGPELSAMFYVDVMTVSRTGDILIRPTLL